MVPTTHVTVQPASEHHRVIKSEADLLGNEKTMVDDLINLLAAKNLTRETASPATRELFWKLVFTQSWNTDYPPPNHRDNWRWRGFQVVMNVGVLNQDLQAPIPTLTVEGNSSVTIEYHGIPPHHRHNSKVSIMAEIVLEPLKIRWMWVDAVAVNLTRATSH